MCKPASPPEAGLLVPGGVAGRSARRRHLSCGQIARPESERTCVGLSTVHDIRLPTGLAGATGSLSRAGEVGVKDENAQDGARDRCADGARLVLNLLVPHPVPLPLGIGDPRSVLRPCCRPRCVKLQAPKRREGELRIPLVLLVPREMSASGSPRGRGDSRRSADFSAPVDAHEPQRHAETSCGRSPFTALYFSGIIWQT